MRMRFSLRLLILAVTLLAIVCYWAFVRPTTIAQSFVSAVEVNNYPQAESLCVDPDNKFLSRTLAELGDSEVRAEIQPREWQDVWKLRQRIFLHIMPRKQSNSNEVLKGGAQLIATPTGIAPPIMRIELQEP